MCKVIDDYIEQGIERGTAASIKKMMKNLNFTIEQAMAALEIPNEKKKAYIELINA